MPAANTYRIDSLARFLMCAVEDSYDTAPTLTPTDVFATQGLEGDIYGGDTEEIRFDGDDGVDVPVITGNPYNGFSFEFYGGGSGSQGIAPVAGKIFRICGADELVTADTSVVYEASDVSSADSGTFNMFQRAAEAKYLQYLTTGARGQLGFSFQEGKKAKFKVSHLMGAYHEPAVLNSAVATDFGEQKTNLPLDTNFANTAALQFDGHQLCVNSLDIDNVFGFEVSRQDLPGCRSTSLKKVTPQINITFRMPDWEQAFNPYAMASTESGVKRKPFLLQIGHTGQHDGKILRIAGAGANETQMTAPKQVTLNDGNVGMSVSLRCLSGLALSYL